MGAAVTAVTWVAFVFLLSGPIGAAPHKNKADDGYGDYGPTLHRGSRGFTLAMHQVPTTAELPGRGRVGYFGQGQGPTLA